MSEQKQNPAPETRTAGLLPLIMTAAILFVIHAGILISTTFVLELIKLTSDVAGNISRLSDAAADASMRCADLTQSYDDRCFNKLELLSHIEETEDIHGEALLSHANDYMKETDAWIISADGTVIRASDRDLPDADAAEALRGVMNGEEANQLLLHNNTRYYCRRLRDGSLAVIARSADELAVFTDNIYTDSEVLQANAADDTGYYFSVKDGIITYFPDASLIGKPVSEVFVNQREIQDYLPSFGGKFWTGRLNGEFVFAGAREGSEPGEAFCYASRVFASGFHVIRAVLFLLASTLFFFVIYILYGYYLMQEKRWDKANTMTLALVRHKLTVAGVLSAAVIAVFTYVSITLLGLSAHVMDDHDQLSAIVHVYRDSEQRVSDLTEEYNQEYLEYAQMIAAWLSDHPEAVTRSELRSLSNIFGLDYIMLFDQEGRETLSDSGFIKFEISANPDDQSYVFNPLKHGIPYVIQKAQPDELTGDYHQFIGVCMTDQEDNADGFLQICYVPLHLDRAIEDASLPILLDDSIISNTDTFFCVDPKTNTFVYSKDHALDGQSALEYGFDETSLSPNFSGYVNVNRVRYFMTSGMIGENYLYIAIPVNSIFTGRRDIVIVSAVLILADLFLLYFLIRRLKVRKPEERFSASLPSETILDYRDEDASLRVETEEGVYKQSLSAYQRWSLLKRSWISMSADQKIILLLERFLYAVVAIFTVMVIFHHHFFDPRSVIPYILSGEWPYGVNAFAFTAIVLLILVVFAAISVLRRLLTAFARLLSPRGETVCRLLKSFIEYVSVLSVLYISLAFLGVDMQSLLASAGILTIVVGFGSKGLIRDILSGLFIVFEREYQVGDVIQIGSYRGTVREIGIRTTKILSWDRNVKVINNHDVNNVVNLTMRSSYAMVSFPVLSTVSIEELEHIFAEELPPLAEVYPTLRGVPKFNGITSFTENKMICSVAAEVEERDRSTIESNLYREVQEILRRHNISFA